MSEKQVRLNPEEYGLPKVDNSPLGIIAMQGDFLRAVSLNKKRPLWVRIFAVVFCVVCLVFPGIFYLTVSALSILNDGISLGVLLSSLLGTLFFIGGIVGIIANIKKV